jgi:hypothetical protein
VKEGGKREGREWEWDTCGRDSYCSALVCNGVIAVTRGGEGVGVQWDSRGSYCLSKVCSGVMGVEMGGMGVGMLATYWSLSRPLQRLTRWRLPAFPLPRCVLLGDLFESGREGSRDTAEPANAR